jgi:hypothetical protein
MNNLSTFLSFLFVVAVFGGVLPELFIASL